ncbi:unnamed protein product, partial [Tenebrio molitor]
YRNFLHIKATVTLLLDLVLYAFNAYTMIVLNFWKTHSWDNLFGKLRASNFAQIKSGTNFKYFLAAHLVHLSIASYTVFVACQKDCLEFFKQYNVEFVQEYLLFLYKCLLPTGRVLLLQIKKVEHSFCLLRKTVAVFNDMFGWPFALIISHTSLELLDIIDSTIYPERDIDFALLITGNLLRVSWNFIGTTVLIVMCDSVTQEAAKMVTLTYDLRWYLHGTTPDEKQEVYEFTNLVLEHLPQFTAANFFEVGRWTILSMLGTISTFLIIMIQFRNG